MLGPASVLAFKAAIVTGLWGFGVILVVVLVLLLLT